jgi:two-component system sensor histidine kinase ChvG
MTVESREIAPVPLLAHRTTRFMWRGRLWWRRLVEWLAQFGDYYRFTSISGRILALNFISVFILVGGLLYLNDFRDDLIVARIRSLEVQAEIIAQAIALGTTPQSRENVSTLNDPLLAMQLGEDSEEFPAAKPYAINPEKSAQLLRDLIQPTHTPGFIYNADGAWLADSSKIYAHGQLVRFNQSVYQSDEEGMLYRLWLKMEGFLRQESLLLFKEGGLDGKVYAEVKSALEQGSTTAMVRVNEIGETILSVAAPIRRGNAKESPVLGALLLTTAPGEIDDKLLEDRLSLMKLVMLVLLVASLLSVILAGTIAGPMHRLALAAQRVRNNIEEREEIPPFDKRKDEIGYLSRALREMTNALYMRLEAIGSFAAEVSHEIKNPLTSLRSATDTLAIVTNEDDRKRLIEVISHDVSRLNRLITDISDFSRLDAELGLEGREPVNIAALLNAMCNVMNDIHQEGTPEVKLHIVGVPTPAAIQSRTLFTINGHESRIGQVINNIVDNARSFSPDNGKIMVTCSRHRKVREVEITIEDEGPGIPEESLEKIFARFYTFRPKVEEFGKNSGLGLSICRQIIEAHGGRIWAENRLAEVGRSERTKLKTASAAKQAKAPILGARFVIRLPLAL